MTWLGLDIGGANLKAADGGGWAKNVPFPLWREPQRLAQQLTELIDAAPAAGSIAVTMTGELCDCFRTKAEGVHYILSAVEQAAGTCELHVYLVDGRIVPIAEARPAPQLAAASNWHVLARLAGRFAGQGPAVLIDVGSTTTDIIPLFDTQPRTAAISDTDRLLGGQLIYSGVGRTPICAVTDTLPCRGQQCAVAAESFATTADAYVLLGDLPEQADCRATADGRPLTRDFARERMARMICADSSSFDMDDARAAARHVRETQVATLAMAFEEAVAELPKRPQRVVTSGAGEFLANYLCRQIMPNTERTSLTQQLGPDVSQCAPAYALAVLASEMAK